MPNVLNVTCGRCGKVLIVDERNAGKSGSCPNCREIIRIPPKEKFQPVEAKKDIKKCPTCGAYLNPGDVICISCYTNLATGEWDLEKAGYKPEKTSYPLLKIAGVLLIGVVVFILGSLIFKEKTHPDLKITSLSKGHDKVTKEKAKKVQDNKVAPQDTKKIEDKVATQKERLEKIPENSLEEIQQKIDSYKKYIESYKIEQAPNMVIALRRLQDKETELLAEQRYRKLESQLKGTDPFLDLLTISSFPIQFQNTEYFKKVQESKNKIIGEILNSLDSCKAKAQELLKNKQYLEILSKISPRLFKSMSNTLTSPEIKGCMEGFIELSMNLEKNLEGASNVTATPVNKEDMLALIKKDYEAYDNRAYDKQSFFMDSMKRREYEKVKTRLNEFLTKLQPLLDNPEEDSMYKDIKSKLDDVDKIEKLFEYVVEGVEKNKGKKVSFWTQNARVVKGSIGKCEGQNICVVNEGKVELVSITELRPEDIVTFVEDVEKGKDVHFITSIFLIYEEKFSLASEEVKKAQNEGADYKDILAFNERVSKSDSEVKKIEEERLKAEKKRNKDNENKREKALREKLKNEARDICERVYSLFKAKENKRVFELLDVLKRKDLDKDDIKKVNEDFKKITGYYLGDIAETCLTDCTYCQKGKVVCPTCRGYNVITKTGSGSVDKKKESWEEACPTCGGTGKVDCDHCKPLRTKQNEILISYFKGIMD